MSASSSTDALATVDPRLTAALQQQLQTRAGERVGWKLGVGDAERLGETVAVGHLTRATLLEPGAMYETRGARLHADAEIAAIVGGGYAAALELVDLGNRDAGPEVVVATNIFHRAVSFGEPQASLPDPVEGRLLVDGDVRAAAHARRFEERLAQVELVLATVGEHLRDGDRVITGSVVQIAVEAGQVVTADFGPLGSVTLRLA
ncbi:MAG: hypothetical protein ACJ74C_08200 [Gaiellaceae bacterium]